MNHVSVNMGYMKLYVIHCKNGIMINVGMIIKNYMVKVFV